MHRRIKSWIAVFILVAAILFGFFYLFKNHQDGVQITKEVEKGTSLLELYEKNNDLVGWIRVPGTIIDYPVMNSDTYLHKNFDKEYEYRGTPFVMSDWTDKTRVSMVFGHNMWVEKTMFNPLHKFEEKDFWQKNQIAEFFVIRGKDSVPYVEKRTYRIHAVCQVSIRDDLYESTQGFDQEMGAIKDLFDKANQGSLYPTGIDWTGGDELALCTCSYHISGDRDSGRILVFGTREGTEEKDICD